MNYPPAYVAWLVDMCEAVDWNLSVLEIIAVEEAYPGLMDDMSIDLWQRRLIERQFEKENKKRG